MTLLMSKMQIFKFHCDANAIIIIMTQNIIRTNKEAQAILLLSHLISYPVCKHIT